MMNTVALHGRLTANPELKHTPSDIAVTSFSLAVNFGFGDSAKVYFIDCVAWRKTAEFICKYFAKGQEMNLTGALQTRTFEDRNGNKRKATEVLAREVDFCGPKKSPAEEKEAVPPAADLSAAFGPDDDLPF